MAQEKVPGLLTIGLILAIIIQGIYGLLLFIIPLQFAAWGQGNPVDAGWLRWPGGVLIGLAVGAILTLRSPAKQGIYVLSLTIAVFLAGLALLFSWITGEYSGQTWFVALPAIVVLVEAVILFFGWQSAKSILS